jgi:DNA helicase II / ATP-dependent DNA helicase PcrA
MNQHQLKFQEGIAQLNPSQKSAVDSIDGCIMVIAGPGSGKTQILGLRIANILEQTDAIPSSILCLTFTDNASYNMRQRLTRFMGNQSSKVNVFTFHSFAKYIMEQFPEYFFLGSYLKPLDPINKTLILENILSGLSSSNKLATKGINDEFVFIGAIAKNIAELKKYGLNPQQFLGLVKENQEYIESYGTQIEELLGVQIIAKNLELIVENLNKIVETATCSPLTKGDARRAEGFSQTSKVDQNIPSLKGTIDQEIQKVIQSIEQTGKTKAFTEFKNKLLELGKLKERKITKKNLELAEIYRLYQKKIRGDGFYDYEDMILEVVAELKANQELRLILQERYQYILVDEFQDTNLAQMELVDGLLNMELTENNPNLFVVGDEDQCIYKFQGAEIENLILFKQKFPHTKVITMTENYRSNQTILDFAQVVIDASGVRLSNIEGFEFINKKLISMTTES